MKPDKEGALAASKDPVEEDDGRLRPGVEHHTCELMQYLICTVLVALEFGFGRGREREARERQEVTSPLRSMPPQTPVYIIWEGQVAPRLDLNPVL